MYRNIHVFWQAKLGKNLLDTKNFDLSHAVEQSYSSNYFDLFKF